MPYTIKLIDPLEDPRWDRFVEEHPFGWICHLSGWKHFLEETFGHIKGHYFALVEKSSNKIQAALPVYEVRSWLTGNRLVSIPFATLCDPLVSSSEELDLLLESVVNLCAELNPSYLEIRTLLSHDLFKTSSFGVVKFYKHHFIKLDKEPEQLKRKFHRSCVKQRINRALKSGLTLRTGNSEADLKSFYNLHTMTRRRRGLPQQPYSFFKNLWDTFYPSRHLSLLMAQKDSKTLATLIMFKFKNRVSVEYAASDNRYVRLSPNHLVFWEAIKLAYEEGYKIFDFGRTSPLNKSLMDFKKRWGTTIVDLPQFIYPDKKAKHLIAHEVSWKYESVNWLCKHAPVFLQKPLGSFCYRHLG